MHDALRVIVASAFSKYYSNDVMLFKNEAIQALDSGQTLWAEMRKDFNQWHYTRLNRGPARTNPAAQVTGLAGRG